MEWLLFPLIVLGPYALVAVAGPFVRKHMSGGTFVSRIDRGARAVGRHSVVAFGVLPGLFGATSLGAIRVSSGFWLSGVLLGVLAFVLGVIVAANAASRYAQRRAAGRVMPVIAGDLQRAGLLTTAAPVLPMIVIGFLTAHLISLLFGP